METTRTTESTTGLRERKKRQTREEISAVATALFAERGFEQVTIADVAAAAGVAKMTVTNHFPLKEDLVFDRAEHIVRGLADAVAERPRGEPVLAAARRYFAASLAAGDPTLGHLGASFARMVEASPALVARERQIQDQRIEALAEVLVAQARPDEELAARVIAAQIGGTYRVLYFTARRMLLNGMPAPELADALGRAAHRAFDLLTADLSGFDPRPRLRSTS
ncbi:TetR/AcrR family transcriptional regulator [Catenulispora subtropica]|uniref:TetR family transcriptional regulator n=1 Tax=Catenulispora subtropica TaxID=450798 RepID=A0ABP5BTR5_9ACTN